MLAKRHANLAQEPAEIGQAVRSSSPGPGYRERMKTIIVAVDFSPVTAALGRTASAFARRLHARLVLVHGVEVRPLPDETGLMLEYTAILAAGAEQSAHRRLARLAQRLKASGLAVDTVCRLESPAALVTGEAARRGAAFIIRSEEHTSELQSH